jgi:hypothetical protein
MLKNEPISNQIIDASICYEDETVCIVCQGNIFVFQNDEISSWPLSHKTGLVGKQWITPIGRTSLYNGRVIFRTAEKNITEDELVWFNPCIYQLDITTKEMTVCREEKTFTRSLWWNLCSKLAKIVVHDIDYISCYDLNKNKLAWNHMDMDYMKPLQEQEELMSSSLGSEICGNLLVTHYCRDGDHTGAIFDIKSGKTSSLVSVSRNFKRVTTRGTLKTFDYLEFERVNEMIY